MIFESFKSLFSLSCTFFLTLFLIFLIYKSDVSIIHNSTQSNVLFSQFCLIMFLSHICCCLFISSILFFYFFYFFFIFNFLIFFYCYFFFVIFDFYYII